MPKNKTIYAGDTLFDQDDTTEPTTQDDLGGGIKAFRETGQIPQLTDGQRRFLGMTAPPEWEMDWFPLSEREHNLALKGVVNQVKSHPRYAIHEAPKAHTDAGRFITSSTLLNEPLDSYEQGTQENGQDIRRDPKALESIARVLVTQEASADGAWLRQGTKKFDALVVQKIADLAEQDQEVVLELATNIARANRLRAAFWRAQVNELEQTAAWRSTVTDAFLARRNDSR